MALWRLENPRHARVLSAMGRAEKKSPNGLQSPQQVFEELGFKFPPGCYAQPGVAGCVDVAHYPSVLARIERELNLQPVRTNVPMKAPARSHAEPASGNSLPAVQLADS
jgi:hypothetical protein